MPRRENASSEPVLDIVDEASRESFPASDAPARTVVTGATQRPIESPTARGPSGASDGPPRDEA